MIKEQLIEMGKLKIITKKFKFHNSPSRNRRPEIIVGKPIHVIQINYPTSNDIEQLHNDYLLAVEQLFVENKDKYGLEHVKLEII
jgi:hypothetical protein